MGAALAAAPHVAWAADSTWTGATDSAWENTANWQGGVVPGNTSGATGTSTDLALFTGTPPQTTIAVDANRNIHTLQFGDIDLPNGPTIAFSIGSAGPNAGNALYLSNGGAIHALSTLVATGDINENKQVRIEAPMVLTGTTYSFISDAGSNDPLDTRPGLALVGSITSGAGAPTTITLSSVSGTTASSRNEAYSTITDGPNGAVVSIVKDGPGAWKMVASSDAPNTYSGDTIINGGILRSGGVSDSNGLGGFSPNSHYIVNDGGHFRHSANPVGDVISAIKKLTINPGGTLSFSSNTLTRLNITSEVGPSIVLNNPTPGTGQPSISFNVFLSLTGTTANEGGVQLIATPGEGGTLPVTLGSSGGATFNMGSVVRVFDIGQGVGIAPNSDPPTPIWDLRVQGAVESPAGFVKTGPGWMQFSHATQNIGGTIEVREGRFDFNSNDAATGSASLLVNGGRFHVFGGHTQSFGALSVTKGSITGSNDQSTVRAPAYNLNVGTGDTALLDIVLADHDAPSTVTKSGAGVATLSGANTYTGNTVIQGGRLVLQGSSAQNHVLGGTSIADIQAGRLAFTYGTNSGAVVSALLPILDAGYDQTPKFSDGAVRSSTATAAIGLGWIDDTAASQVVVARTYFGDADLNGQVDVADLGILASNWQSAGNWGQADFDYSGLVDVNDLGLLASNWQAGVGSPLGPSLAEALATVGLGHVAVPEPASIGLIGVLASWSLKRPARRRA